MVTLLNKFGHAISNETTQRVVMLLENTVINEENVTNERNHERIQLMYRNSLGQLLYQP